MRPNKRQCKYESIVYEQAFPGCCEIWGAPEVRRVIERREGCSRIPLCERRIEQHNVSEMEGHVTRESAVRCIADVDLTARESILGRIVLIRQGPLPNPM